jgi:hypothetical protein
MRDGRVPLRVKMIVVAALLYLISPINLRLLFIPVVGVLDGLTVLLLAAGLFVWLSPRALVREHLDRMAGKPPKGPSDTSNLRRRCRYARCQVHYLRTPRVPKRYRKE